MMRIEAVLMLAGAAGGAMSGQQPPVAGARTVQQDFDAATALDRGSDATAALTAWEALERRTQGNRRSLAIMRLRKGAALMRLGRLDEATVSVRLGLAQLPPGDPSLAVDRAQGQLIIARVAERALDYAGAAEAFRLAEQASSDPVIQVASMLGQIRTLTFTDTAAAMAVLARAESFLKTHPGDKGVMASLASTKGVLLLNRRDFGGARVATMDAVKLQGGLTSKVDLNDVSARQDAALANLLSGNTEAARQYMAMTGAGRLGDKGSFRPGAGLEPPPCGGEAGLKPDDMAIVEFSIGDDGAIIVARPIYAEGGGAVAMEFARAAAGWTWDPDAVKAMPLFFRYNARLELRCNMAFERPSVMSPFNDAVETWVAARKIAISPVQEGNAVSKAAAARAALAKADGVAQLPYLLRLVRSPLVSREETFALATRAVEIAQAAGAPEAVRLPFDLPVQTMRKVGNDGGGGFRRAVEPLLARYTDAQALGAIRLLLADAGGSAEGQRALLDAVVADQRLARNDPLKVGALIRLASLNQAKGDAEAARAAFEQSGLAVNQCALLDRPPRLIAAGGTFPMEAFSWGFEGWTRVQYDVGADGQVLKPRVIASYPPFIFSKAGAATMKGARYSKTYRPDGGVGCGAVTQQVRFTMYR